MWLEHVRSVCGCVSMYHICYSSGRIWWANQGAGFMFVLYVTTTDTSQSDNHKPTTCIRGLLASTVTSVLVHDVFLFETHKWYMTYSCLKCINDTFQSGNNNAESIWCPTQWIWNDMGAAKAPPPCLMCYTWPVKVSVSAFLWSISLCGSASKRILCLFTGVSTFSKRDKLQNQQMYELEWLYLALILQYQSLRTSLSTWQCSAVRWGCSNCDLCMSIANAIIWSFVAKYMLACTFGSEGYHSASLSSYSTETIPRIPIM